jgi:hypothetical protein
MTHEGENARCLRHLEKASGNLLEAEDVRRA